jgi:hypothetical protein
MAKTWCAQNDSLGESWFTAERLNALFLAGVGSVHGTPPAWDAHIQFFQSTAGKEYDNLLLERFEATRKGQASLWRQLQVIRSSYGPESSIFSPFTLRNTRSLVTSRPER